MSVNCQQSFVNLCYVIILLVQFLSVFSLLTRTVYLLTFTVCLTYIILQWLNRGRVGYPQTSLTPPNFCAYPKSGVQPIVCLVVFLLWLYMFYMSWSLEGHLFHCSVVSDQRPIVDHPLVWVTSPFIEDLRMAFSCIFFNFGLLSF